MTLIEGGGGAIRAREITVLRGERGLQVGRIVDRVRPGVGRQELVMVVEALAEIDGQPVVVRSAVRIVGVHVAKGDAAGVIERGRRGVASRIEPWERSEKSLGLRHAWSLAAQIESGGDRGIQTAGTEEVHEGRIHVRYRIAWLSAPTDREWASRGSAARDWVMGRVVRCREEIGRHQVPAYGAGINRTVEVAAKVEVVGDAEGAVDGQFCLLRVGVNEVLRLRVTEGLEAEWKESATCQVEIVLTEEN